jgi:hypothetical protein
MRRPPRDVRSEDAVHLIAAQRWALLEAAWRKDLDAERAAEGLEPIHTEPIPLPRIRTAPKIGGTASVDTNAPWEGIGGEIVLSKEFAEQVSDDALARQLDHTMIVILVNEGFVDGLAIHGLSKQPEDIENAIRSGNLRPGDPDQPNWLVGPETHLGKLLKGMTPKTIRQIAGAKAKKLIDMSAGSLGNVEQATREVQAFSDNDPALLPHQRLMRRLARALYPFRTGSRPERWFNKLDAVVSRPFLWILRPFNRLVYGTFRGPTQAELFPDRKMGFPRDHGVLPYKDWQRTRAAERQAESVMQISDGPERQPDATRSTGAQIEQTIRAPHHALAHGDLAGARGLTSGRGLTD